MGDGENASEPVHEGPRNVLQVDTEICVAPVTRVFESHRKLVSNTRDS